MNLSEMVAKYYAEALQKAVNRERERCARIAEHAPYEPFVGTNPKQVADKIGSGEDWTADEIEDSANPLHDK